MDMEEDEDIFERMLDVGNTIEGVRINSDLYEAYGTNVGAGPSARALSSTPSSEDAPSPVVSHPPYFRWPPSSYGPAPTNLTRQPSIRRPVRPSSRSVDFNEFTHRRRSSTRENSNTHVEPNDSLSAVRNWVGPPQNPARRFFPFIRRRFEHADPWSSDIPPPETEEPNGPLNYDSADPPSGPWFSLTPPVPRETSTMEEVLADVELSDERVHASVVPRLRRGGLRAPESILSRHTSPFPNPNPLHDDGASGENTLTDATGNTPPGEPAGGYPTPGSTDHEFFP
ncbi:hypothetical protein H0H81_005853 [Sphagnurus paluster]|uniref:Uncharacterized protein n=1 Tax=Sphagnurus paluster TaxID=117069 RepID=A0A9P7G2H5_9AGAR|nr:hypothetical protein H0H81_005853 [Sphagnurus paluster]